jgi:hypothetical protein
MRYFLWIDGKEAGPYQPELIREMFSHGKITFVTPALPEDRTGEWLSMDNFPGLIRSAMPHESPTINQKTENKINAHQVEEILFKESSVEKPGVASVLSAIAIFELILSPIVGIVEGSENPFAGCMIFICGFTGGLILLGFSRIIEHSFESAQRLRRIESLLLKAIDKTTRPKT